MLTLPGWGQLFLHFMVMASFSVQDLKGCSATMVPTKHAVLGKRRNQNVKGVFTPETSFHGLTCCHHDSACQGRASELNNLDAQPAGWRRFQAATTAK